MRHRIRGRKLGRSPSHRRAMLRNMACSLIRTLDQDEDDPHRPKVSGRITTTLPKAKELRPFVEKLITLAKKGRRLQEAVPERVDKYERAGDGTLKLDSRNRPSKTGDWLRWRETEDYQVWNQAIAPAIACRRRAFALLRDKKAVRILFDELAERFMDRPGGYTRIIKLAGVRLGDAGRQAFIEFVGEEDRVDRRPQLEVDDEEDTGEEKDGEVEEAGDDESQGDDPADEAAGEEAGEEEDDAEESGEASESEDGVDDEAEAGGEAEDKKDTDEPGDG